MKFKVNRCIVSSEGVFNCDIIYDSTKYSPELINSMILSGVIEDNSHISSGGVGGDIDESQIDISQVPYYIEKINSESLKHIVDSLLYVDPVITAFSITPSIVEKGTQVTNPVLNWAINKDVVEQNINNGVGSINKDSRSITINSTITDNRSYTLTVNDGQKSVSRSASISFRNKIYYGISDLESLMNDDVLNLNGELATSRTKTATFNPVNQFIYFVFPTSFGTPSFKVNGLTNDAWVTTTFNHINNQRHTESYTIYRSQFRQNGADIVIEVT